MKLRWLFIVGLLVTGCATRQDLSGVSAVVSSQPLQSMATRSLPEVASTPSSEGEQALADIQRWYNSNSESCGSNKPAYECGGVMLRATESMNPLFYPWDPNPSSSGVSFSWLRHDTNFKSLVFSYWNGYVVYPNDDRPPGKDSLSILCVFPMDSDTNSRTQNGCGPTGVPSSGPCDQQNITTASSWLIHFNAAGNKYQGQCGWSMRKVDSARWFIAFIDARKGLENVWWEIQNEVRMTNWGQGRGANLPIRAFFYVPGKLNALEKAKDDQRRYRAAYGLTVPIIRMTLPQTKSGYASFAYSDADQGGEGPGPGPGIVVDFENVALQQVVLLNLPDLSVQNMNAGSGIPMYVEAGGNRPYVSGRHMVIKSNRPGASMKLTTKTSASRLTLGYAVETNGADLLVNGDCYFKDGSHQRVSQVGTDGKLTCDGSSRGGVREIVVDASVITTGAALTLRVDNVSLD